jgi:flagellar basal-body rod protein FlgF
MNEVLSIALQGMQHDMAKVERVGINLANIQTPGYKREVLAGMPFAQRLNAAQAQAEGRSVAHAAVPTPGTFVDQRPGTLKATGQSLDVALAGPGWFEVSTPQGPAYTRQGNFRLDAQGRLVTVQGYPVMGVGGEIQLPHGMPVIDPQGRVVEGSLPGAAPVGSGGAPVAQLKVVVFEAKAPLEKLGEGLVSAGGAPSIASDGQVDVRQGYLENSNVSSMQEMVQLIQAMRHFESMQKVALGYDEMIGVAVRKLGETA